MDSSALRSILDTPELPDLGPAPRASRWPLAELEPRLAEHLPHADLSAENQSAFRAAALLWHDHLEESHAISQTISGPTGCFLHGIMHRREPDYTNAKYWFHRVGQHEVFPEISRAALPFLTRRGSPTLASQLVPNGLWDPFAFIDACAHSTPDPHHPDRAALVEIQRIEFQALVNHLLA
jgi:hypothetical protein